MPEALSELVTNVGDLPSVNNFGRIMITVPIGMGDLLVVERIWWQRWRRVNQTVCGVLAGARSQQRLRLGI